MNKPIFCVGDKKESHDVYLDPEFRSICPALNADSLEELRQSLKREGLLSALVIGTVKHGGDEKYILLDGYNRFDIIQGEQSLLHQDKGDRGLLRLVYEDARIITRLDFPNEARIFTRDEAKLWILTNQVGRRNLTDDQRAIIWARIRESRSVIAKTERSAKPLLKLAHELREVQQSFPCRLDFSDVAGISGILARRQETAAEEKMWQQRKQQETEIDEIVRQYE